MIVAADIEVNVDKFAGKRMYRTSTSAALKKTAQEMDKALKEARVFQASVAPLLRHRAAREKNAVFIAIC